MTIEFQQRCDDLLSGLLSCDFRTEVGIDKAKELIRRSLKKEQKITRHACAEVANEFRDPETAQRIHNQIINTKAV